VIQAYNRGHQNKKNEPRVISHAFKQHGRCDIMSFNKHKWYGNLRDAAVVLYIEYIGVIYNGKSLSFFVGAQVPSAYP